MAAAIAWSVADTTELPAGTATEVTTERNGVLSIPLTGPTAHAEPCSRGCEKS